LPREKRGAHRFLELQKADLATLKKGDVEGEIKKAKGKIFI
jgi:hypothetical protein